MIRTWTLPFCSEFSMGIPAQTRGARRIARVPAAGPSRRATASIASQQDARGHAEPDHPQPQEVGRNETERPWQEQERRRIFVGVDPERAHRLGHALLGRIAGQRVEGIVIDVGDGGNGLAGHEIGGETGVAPLPLAGREHGIRGQMRRHHEDGKARELAEGDDRRDGGEDQERTRGGTQVVGHDGALPDVHAGGGADGERDRHRGGEGAGDPGPDRKPGIRRRSRLRR